MDELRGFAAGVALAIVFLAGPARAGTAYCVDANASSISAHSSGDGLLINTSLIVADDYTFSLNNVGDSHTFDFFEIWTPEDWVNVGEDTLAKPISATLAFSIPLAAGTVSGSTQGVSIGVGGFYQAGQVTWSGPVLVNSALGQFQISLSDEVFNTGSWWTGPGCKGATVEATVTQVSLVPLPPAFWSGALLLGLCAVGSIRRRLRGR